MDKGWQLIELSSHSKSALGEAILEMEAFIGCKLEDYQMVDDAEHIALQSTLAKRFIAAEYGREIIGRSLFWFQQLMGTDLHIQKYPYLRIARPGKPQDNIGIHRDTLYGCTPYEISVVIPLTDTDEQSALHVIDNSHVAPESDYLYEEEDTDVVKNSDKHNLGFVYLKKKLSPDLKTHPVPMKVGQALAFPLSLVHGQEVNNGKTPRFSVDIRLVNSLANIEWSRTVHKDYWERLCECPVTSQARKYYEANAS